MSDSPLRTLVVDDEAMAIERMQVLLSRFDDVNLVGTASTGGQALRLIEALSPDLLLLDISMPGAGGDTQSIGPIVGYLIERGYSGQADKDIRSQSTLAHPDDHRSAAGYQVGTFAMLIEQNTSFLQTLGLKVVEVVHFWVLDLVARKPSRTLAGVMGSVEIRTPIASKTAFPMAAAVGSVPSSPRPFAPKGPVGS